MPDLTANSTACEISRSHLICLTLIACLFLILAGYRLNAKWLPAGQGDAAYAGSQYHAIARQQLTHGAIHLRFAQFRVFHDLSEKEIFASDGTFRGKELRQKYGDRFWVSRLPFGALLYTASLAIFGDTEWAVRLLPYLATFFLLLTMFVLLRKIIGTNAALASTAVFALIPATVLNARLAGYEMPCLFLVTLTFLLYDQYREGAGSFVWIGGTAAAAGLLGWFGLYLIPILLFESFRPCSPRRLTWRGRLFLCLIPLCVGGLYLLYMEWLGQSVVERLAYFWQKRSLGLGTVGSGAVGIAKESMSAPEYLYRIQKFFVNHVTPLPLILAAGWLVAYLKARRRGVRYRESRLVFMLTIFALMCFCITLRASYEHRYYVLWTLPMFGLTGGCFLARWWAGTWGEVLPYSTLNTEKLEAGYVNQTPRWQRRVIILALFSLLACTVYKVQRHQAKTFGHETLFSFFADVKKSARIPPNEEVFILAAPNHGKSWMSTASISAQTFSLHKKNNPLLFYLWRPLQQAYFWRQDAHGAASLYTRQIICIQLDKNTIWEDLYQEQGQVPVAKSRTLRAKKLLTRESGTVWRVWNKETRQSP